MSISAAPVYASTVSLKLTGSVSTGSAADRSTSSPAKGAATEPNGGGNASVIVSLSIEARTVMASATGTAGTEAAKAPMSRFAVYFPTRDGKPVTALADAVDNPGALSSSAGKTLSEAAKDARARMDAQYAAMDASGEPFNANSYEGRDWHTVMGDLDRRSLYAISSNTEGLFSEEEQTTARDMMIQQQGLAMGLYSGPTRLEGTFVDPYNGDMTAHMKAGVKFLDKVSDEEKTSIDWAMDRAGAQWNYEASLHNTRKELQELEKLSDGTPVGMLLKSAKDLARKNAKREEGGEPEKLDSDNPLAKLVMNALNTMKNNPGRGNTHGLIRTAEDLKDQPWFKGFESQLDTAIQQTKDMYSKGKASEKAYLVAPDPGG
jgi:hypothetical protein